MFPLQRVWTHCHLMSLEGSHHPPSLGADRSTHLQGKDRKGTRQQQGAGLWSIKNDFAQEVDPGECVKWRDHVDEMFQRTLRRSAARRPHPGSRWKDNRDGSRGGGRPGMRRTDRARHPLPMGIDKEASPGRRRARGTDQQTDSEMTGREEEGAGVGCRQQHPPLPHDPTRRHRGDDHIPQRVGRGPVRTSPRRKEEAHTQPEERLKQYVRFSNRGATPTGWRRRTAGGRAATRPHSPRDKKQC